VLAEFDRRWRNAIANPICQGEFEARDHSRLGSGNCGGIPRGIRTVKPTVWSRARCHSLKNDRSKLTFYAGRRRYL
jgi:hypothetical protein